MIDSPIIRLLMMPLLALLTLTACNLSVTAGASSELTQVIITETPQPEQDTNVEFTSESGESDDGAGTTDVSTNTQPVNQVSSEGNNTSTGDDLYYVRGNRPLEQCGVQATVTTNIRTADSINATIVGQLVGGEWVPISRLVNGWYQIDLSSSPVHRMWISSEPTVLDNLCDCGTNGCDRDLSAPVSDIGDTLYYAGNPLPAPPDRCYVYTSGDFNVNIRAAQSETATVLGQLLANHWIPVRHLTNGWFGVELPDTPIDGAYIANGPVRLTTTCHCNDTSCRVQSGVSVCELSLHPNTTTRVYAEPANWSAVVGELASSEAYLAVAQSSSGWYQLDIGGWVPSNYLMLSSGESCHNLPRIIYDGPLLACELVNTTDEIAVIYDEPNGEYFGRFGVNLRLGVIKREGDWYQVYVPAFSNAGWIDGTDMSLSGSCSDFQ